MTPLQIALESRLREAFQPSELEIQDESHFHKHHKQAGGGAHFRVAIRSQKFNGLSPLARQRLVFEVVGTLMDKEIHALALQCLPNESAK
jgi:BolA family transcriptional regulator, general stress-responsive regulator